jgi:hypothetical protein
MKTYTYCYQADSLKEPIGQVTANNICEARILISEIKQLDVASVERLFEIKEKRNETRKTKN